MDAITLQTKQDLDIFVNPRRQSILRCLRIAGEPMTPKQIADQIGISASSVQHHIGKLLSIGVVELSRTESIHGITARFYRLVPKSISIGLGVHAENQEQRIAVLENTMAQLLSGFTEYCVHKLPDANPAEQHGDMLSGLLYLEPDKARELYAIIQSFIQTHETKTAGSSAWEFALIAYPVQKEQA